MIEYQKILYTTRGKDGVSLTIQGGLLQAGSENYFI